MDVFSFVLDQWPLVAALVVMVAGFLYLESKKGGSVVSHHQATRLVNSGEAVIVDIRDTNEFKAGHIIDAINVPFADLALKSERLDKYKSKQLILADKGGQQTGAGGKILRDKGFTVVRLNGGMAEWVHQNLPVVKA